VNPYPAARQPQDDIGIALAPTARRSYIGLMISISSGAFTALAGRQPEASERDGWGGYKLSLRGSARFRRSAVVRRTSDGMVVGGTELPPPGHNKGPHPFSRLRIIVL
jgi:hypothetical protein